MIITFSTSVWIQRPRIYFITDVFTAAVFVVALTSLWWNVWNRPSKCPLTLHLPNNCKTSVLFVTSKASALHYASVAHPTPPIDLLRPPSQLTRRLQSLVPVFPFFWPWDHLWWNQYHTTTQRTGISGSRSSEKRWIHLFTFTIRYTCDIADSSGMLSLLRPGGEGGGVLP